MIACNLRDRLENRQGKRVTEGVLPKLEAGSPWFRGSRLISILGGR